MSCLIIEKVVALGARVFMILISGVSANFTLDVPLIKRKSHVMTLLTFGRLEGPPCISYSKLSDYLGKEYLGGLVDEARNMSVPRVSQI